MHYQRPLEFSRKIPAECQGDQAFAFRAFIQPRLVLTFVFDLI